VFAFADEQTRERVAKKGGEEVDSIKNQRRQ
jgi:hypothetical protein